MEMVLGHEIGPAICAVLGLDVSKIRSITLRFAVGEIASVDIVQFVIDTEAQQIVESLHRYELHLIKGPEEVVINDFTG